MALPYDGSPVAQIFCADPATLARAVDAARAGARIMAELTNAERADLLMRLHDLLKRDLEDFAHVICIESGKPIKEARVEAERGVQTLLFSAQEARNLHGEVVPIDGAPAGKGRLAITIRQPLGVIAAITPFNFPLNLSLHKIGPAIAGGNAVVHKPSEQTPLSALRLARAFEEAGAPKGAYNVITGGAAIGEQLIGNPSIAMITFTGSVPVGKMIRAKAGLKRVTLEMGNNSAVILEPDANLEAAVPRVVAGSFANSGQVCISVQRIYVQERIAEEFLERFVPAVQKLRIGHPLEESTDISSLVSEAAAIRVDEWMEEAVNGGARRLTGGARHPPQFRRRFWKMFRRARRFHVRKPSDRWWLSTATPNWTRRLSR